MTNFDWMNTLTEQELTNLVKRSTHLVEHATHLLAEKDKQIAKEYIKTIRDCCLAIENLHTDIPTLPYCLKWINLAHDFDELLTSCFS